MGDNGEKVQLYVYDLSNGLARQLSPMLLNKQVCACSYSMWAQEVWAPVFYEPANVCRSTASGILPSWLEGLNTSTVGA